jgi:SAM-dependent methyltransferase
MATNIYVCPVCKGPLDCTDQGYTCPTCARDYPIIDGIPDFFISNGNEAEDPVWHDNSVYLDPRMAEARETIYRLSVRNLQGMTFAMQRLAPLTFPGCRILEVGTGTGHFARWMAEVSAPGTEIYAFDFSWPMFAYARQNVAGLPGVFLLRANATGKLPFREGSFDFVFLRLAPLGENGIWNVLAACHLLKPGGWLFKAGWQPRPNEAPWTQAAIATGYACAETHEWQYPRTRTREEYAASRVEYEQALEYERAVACDATRYKSDRRLPPDAPATLPEEPDSDEMMVWENLRIARKA